MKRPTLVSQGSLTRIIAAAVETWKRCDFQAAIEMMERAGRLAPSNPFILLDLGRMHGLRFDYAAAERCFEQAVRVAPGKSDALVVASQHCRNFNNLFLAEKYLRRALDQKNAAPITLVLLAEIYERLRRTEEAAVLVERALQRDAACAPALLLKSRLARKAGRLDEAERLLKTFPAKVEPGLRASAAYELGGIFDRQGRYDEAMAAFLQAKSFLQPMAGPALVELKTLRTRIRYLAENASAEVIKEWSKTAGELQPVRRLALLGGHPRSGTTLLEQVLDSHPDIVSAEETEAFYNEAYGPRLRGHPDDVAMYAALASITPEALQQSRQNYFRAIDLSLGQPVAGRLLVDKNPSYTFFIPALIRIFPEIKFLIALRDPRDVILSCFMQDLPLNHASAAWLTLAGAAREFSDLMGVWQTTKARMRNGYLEVRYEDMVDDLEATSHKVLNFLDVPWDPRVLGFDEHARRKTVRSPTYTDVAQPLYKRAVGRWRRYQKYLEPHLEELAPFVRAFGYD